MNEQPGTGAPVARLDRITRLKVLAEGLPGTVVRETVLDAPFEQAWGALTDFERSVPFFEVDVAWLRIVGRHGDPATGEKLRIASRLTARGLWLRGTLDMDLAPGWCWMVARPQLYVIGMAAEPLDEGHRTRLAHLEGISLPVPRALRPLARPVLALSRWRHRRHVPHDLAGMQRFVRREIDGR